MLDILQREVKQRKDSLQEFTKAGRDDLAADVQAEIDIIGGYLPEQITKRSEALFTTIQEVGASSKADMGKVMWSLYAQGEKARSDTAVLLTRLCSNFFNNVRAEDSVLNRRSLFSFFYDRFFGASRLYIERINAILKQQSSQNNI